LYVLTRPKIIPQKSATTDHILKFHTVINTVQCLDPTEWNMLNIYIYICIAFYLLLIYCIDGPMVVVNYRNMKLFLNKRSCVQTDSTQYVFKHCTNTTGSTPFNLTLCIQCVEYIDRNRVYKGMMITHHKNHLHNLETLPARMHAA
jgi:hypothetical protein